MLLNNEHNASFALSNRLKHFFIYFLLWTFALQLLVFAASNTPEFIDFVTNALAQLSTVLYTLAVEPNSLLNNQLIHTESGRYLVIDSNSTALPLTATLVAALLSTEFSWTKRIVAIVIAVLLLQIENVVRITHLFYEIKQPVNSFHLFNLYIWQFVLFVSAIVIFYWLYNWLQKREKSTESN